MRFQEPLKTAESARAALERARTDREGWSDDLRQQFDDQRLRPLTETATKLLVALQRAQEQSDAAERLLSN
jgi:hypothetical protein